MQKSDVAGRARPSETSPSEAVTSKLRPGSDWAIGAGCRCPRMDNAYGRGAWGSEGPNAIFVITDGCPLHAPSLAESGKRASRDTPSSPEGTEASQAKPPHTPVED